MTSINSSPALRLSTMVQTECEKYVMATTSNEAKDRISQELDAISYADNEAYFLTMAEIIYKMKQKGHEVRCRNTLNASFVAYLLGITSIDPFEYDLPYEICFGLHGENNVIYDFDYPQNAYDDLIKSAEDIQMPEGIWVAESEHVGLMDSLQDKPILFYKSQLMEEMSKFKISTGIDYKHINKNDSAVTRFLINHYADSNAMIARNSEKWKSIIDRLSPKALMDLAYCHSLCLSGGAWENKGTIISSCEDLYQMLLRHFDRETALSITKFVKAGGFYWKQEPKYSTYKQMMANNGLDDLTCSFEKIRNLWTKNETLSCVVYMYYWFYYQLRHTSLVSN